MTRLPIHRRGAAPLAGRGARRPASAPGRPAANGRWAPLLAAALALQVTGCAGLPASVPRGGAFDAKRLEGGWHVLASNFPMWLEGNKADPIFIYRLQPSGDAVTLDDTVAYTESGRRETIEGTDTQDPGVPAHFTWRGKGILAAFSSDWVIAHESPDQRWMILYFTKTIATPEGVDVIAKIPVLTPEDRAAVDKVLAENPFLKGKSAGLVWLGARKGK